MRIENKIFLLANQTAYNVTSLYISIETNIHLQTYKIILCWQHCEVKTVTITFYVFQSQNHYDVLHCNGYIFSIRLYEHNIHTVIKRDNTLYDNMNICFILAHTISNIICN